MLKMFTTGSIPHEFQADHGELAREKPPPWWSVLIDRHKSNRPCGGRSVVFLSSRNRVLSARAFCPSLKSLSVVCCSNQTLGGLVDSSCTNRGHVAVKPWRKPFCEMLQAIVRFVGYNLKETRVCRTVFLLELSKDSDASICRVVAD